MQILDSARGKPAWDDVQKAPFAMWESHGVFRHAWLEDARVLVKRVPLAAGRRACSIGDPDCTSTWRALHGRAALSAMRLTRD
jgi:hypothetical protein